MDRLDQKLGRKDLQGERQHYTAAIDDSNSGADIFPSRPVVYQCQPPALCSVYTQKRILPDKLKLQQLGTSATFST